MTMLREPTQRGFVLRFAILAILLLLLPGLANVLNGEDERLLLAPPIVAAAIVIIGFIWWRAESLLAFALFVLFYDTLALYMSGPVRRFDEMAVPGLALVAVWGALPRIREWWYWPRDAAFALVVAIGIASSLANHVPLTIWGIQLVLVVKAIVERHGGSISAASSPTSGTTFTIVLPDKRTVSPAVLAATV